MGAAEGTKMDDDFVEMERVRNLFKYYLNFFINSYLMPENGYYVRVSGRAPDEDERIPPAQSNSKG